MAKEIGLPGAAAAYRGAEEMTPAQIAEAQRLAAEWNPATEGAN